MRQKYRHSCGEIYLEHHVHPLPFDSVLGNEIIVTVCVVNADRSKRFLNVIRLMVYLGWCYNMLAWAVSQRYMVYTIVEKKSP